MDNLKPPAPLDLSEDNLPQKFTSWRKQIKMYLRATEADKKSKSVQTAIILNCAGAQILEIYEHFEFAQEDDKNDPEIVLEKINQYCNPRSSEVYLTYRFWSAPICEPFDAFLTEIRTKAEVCNFGDLKDRMIRDKLVFSAVGNLKEKLLQKEKLDLKAAVSTCRAHEITKKQAHDMSDSPAVNRTQAVSPGGRSKKQATGSSANSKGDCGYCGYSHPPRKCPAWGKVCDNCNKPNHFKSVCRRVKFIEKDDKDPEMDQPQQLQTGWLNQIQTSKQLNHVSSQETALMLVNGCNVRFQLDTGAEVNTICQKFVKANQVTPTTTTLKMWNKSTLAPLGMATLTTMNPKSEEACNIEYIVVPNGYTSLLGLKTVQDMGLFTVHREKFVAHVEADKLGDLGVARLYINPEVRPRVLPCRRIPFAIQDDVKRDIEKLVDRGILIPVDKPSEWVSQMAVARKSNGKLRICIDPQPLNGALQRQHYQLPTLDDVLPKLHESRVFSKLDVQEAFWHIKLDDDSSMLTTMITPFGRFRWARLPFGLCVSSEVFKKNCMKPLKGCTGYSVWLMIW
jgi:hypothetical protein